MKMNENIEAVIESLSQKQQEIEELKVEPKEHEKLLKTHIQNSRDRSRKRFR